MLEDHSRLIRLLKNSRRNTHKLEDEVERSRHRLKTRRDARPAVKIEPSLPISEKKTEIESTIRDNPVSIIVGETGSGKSTQIPKLCLEIGRGSQGIIGHTQPRRIAARSIAMRIAEELHTKPGEAVGYKVRFRDQVGPNTYIKILTDGMLLAELESDRKLSKYDTIIIDEAHERSLNIDFLLGYLTRLLSKRQDLKLIVTSATIDAQRFSEFFGNAPVIEVSGRTFPVEVRYTDETELSVEDQIVKAIDQLPVEPKGDVLVFLPGEREIRETASLLENKQLRHTEILPLYARLTMEQQQAVFRPHTGRRIVLSTNVAETSLTVPGVRYVVDTGLARISRYRPGRQIQALPVEPVSRASANQRKGRCGRIASGVCIRLYSEADFNSRAEFTEPEIHRVSLASAILKMKHLGLGEIDQYPFIEPPATAMIRDGYRLLQELAAMNEELELTPIGRKLARLPVDPRLGRIVLEASKLGCVTEALVICAALAVQDPRYYPPESEQQAREKHRRFVHPESDFLTFVNLWHDYSENTKGHTQRQKRKYCLDNFLSFPRMQEWRDVKRQLVELTGKLGFRCNTTPADEALLHQSILSGYLGNIGHREERGEYMGARGKKFLIHPASRQRKNTGKWIVCGELVDTTRLYGRTTATVKPEWIESSAQHLVKKAYLEPHWVPDQGRVIAYEKVTMYDLTLVARRPVHFGPIDADLARSIFIREALVENNIAITLPFQIANQELIDQVRKLEHKSRRHDVLVDEEVLYQFFNQRIPTGIYDIKRFSRWYRKASINNPDLLCMSKQLLMRRLAEDITTDRFPEFLVVNENTLPCRYHFEPGHPNDGVTISIPLPLLKQLDDTLFSWVVPGLLLEKIIFLLRSLPKALRKEIAPITSTAEQCLHQLAVGEGELKSSLSESLKRLTGAQIHTRDWNESALPNHLRLNFEITSPEGNPVDYGRDIHVLQARNQEKLSSIQGNAVSPGIEQSGITCWDFPALPDQVAMVSADTTLTGYPALIDDGTTVSIKVLDDPAIATAAHRAGIRRLILLQLPHHSRQMRKGPPGIEKMCLNFATRGSCKELRQDLIDAALDHVLFEGNGDIRNEIDFKNAVESAKTTLIDTFNQLCTLTDQVLDIYRFCATDVAGVSGPTGKDVRQQLDSLVYPGFVSTTGFDQLRQLPRYLQAIRLRLERANHHPAKDLAGIVEISPHQSRLDTIQDNILSYEKCREYRWLVEEYRVSIFAQNLGTRVPASAKRLEKLWREIDLSETQPIR